MRLKNIISLAALTLAAGFIFSGNAQSSITSYPTVNSSNPHYLINNGTPLVLMGAGQPVPGKKTANYRAQIDEMAAYKVNYGRIWHLRAWDSANTYWPWARTGSGTANDGLPKFNLTQWDSTFWSRLKDACAYAQSKNIYLSIMLYDECGLELENAATSYKYHPFHPSNNVNSVGLPSSDAVPEFYNLSNSTLKRIQELYVSKLISEVGGYPNIIIEICNEYTGPSDWENYWIDYVNARCSNLISANRLGTPSSSYWTNPKIDIVNVHLSTTDAGTVNSRMLSYYPKNRPVNYDETPENGLTAAGARNSLWASFVAGGHLHIENGNLIIPSYEAIMHWTNFVQSNGVRFWEMAPNNALVTRTPGGSAYTLAKTGSEYVTYIAGSGGGSMDISLDTSKTYTAKALNPVTGGYTNLSISGKTISGIPSYSTGVVVYIKSNSAPVTTSPNVSLTMAVDKTQASSGDLLSFTITFKNNGTGSANSVAVTTPVPAYTTYVAGSATSSGVYDSITRTIKWTISSIPAGSSGTLTFKVNIN